MIPLPIKTYIVYSKDKEVNFAFQFSDDLIGKLLSKKGPLSLDESLKDVLGKGGVALLHISDLKKYLDERHNNSEELYHRCLEIIGNS